MASSGLGFMVLLVGLIFGGLVLVQSGSLAINELSSAHDKEIQELKELHNQDIEASVEFDEIDGEDNELLVLIENNGSNTIDMRSVSILFENNLLDINDDENIELNGDSYEIINTTIEGNEYPQERYHLPPNGEFILQLETDSDSGPELINIMTDNGIKKSLVVDNG